MRTPPIFKALAASVLAHALLLAWPLSLPGGPGLGLAAERAPLRAYLAALPVKPMREEETRTAAASAPLPAPAPARESGSATPLPTYYTAKALSRMPEAISRFDVLPPAGGDQGITGKLSLRLWIDESGRLERLKVIESELPKAYEDAAVEAFMRLHFTPGEIKGVPVRVSLDVVIEYADMRKMFPDAAN